MNKKGQIEFIMILTAVVLSILMFGVIKTSNPKTKILRMEKAYERPIKFVPCQGYFIQTRSGDWVAEDKYIGDTK
jgi:hypothetical protein